METDEWADEEEDFEEECCDYGCEFCDYPDLRKLNLCTIECPTYWENG